MGAVIFNIHDMVLVMTALLCCLFALMVVVSHKFKRASAYLLAGFLIAHALIAVHELILFGGQFRWIVLDISPNLFFIGSFAYCLDGPLLYLYVVSLLYSDFRFRKKYLWHLLPIVFYSIYMLVAYYLQSDEFKGYAIRGFRFDMIWQYLQIDTLVKASRFGYLLLCLFLIREYRDRLKETRSDIEAIDLSWLKLLVVGFLTVIFVDLLLSGTKLVTPELKVLVLIGLSSYYAVFILVNLLLFFSAVNISSLERIKQNPQRQKNGSQDTVDPEYIERIRCFMRDSKPYLMTNITFDALSEQLDIPSRELSATLNGHFKMNFYEFINNYRIEEAKELLTAQAHQVKTITDIFTEVGFNSKSVFNTCFKKSVGVTPSEYRRSYSAD